MLHAAVCSTNRLAWRGGARPVVPRGAHALGQLPTRAHPPRGASSRVARSPPPAAKVTPVRMWAAPARSARCCACCACCAGMRGCGQGQGLRGVCADGRWPAGCPLGGQSSAARSTRPTGAYHRRGHSPHREAMPPPVVGAGVLMRSPAQRAVSGLVSSSLVVMTSVASKIPHKERNSENNPTAGQKHVALMKS